MMDPQHVQQNDSYPTPPNYLTLPPQKKHQAQRLEFLPAVSMLTSAQMQYTVFCTPGTAEYYK